MFQKKIFDLLFVAIILCGKCQPEQLGIKGEWRIKHAKKNCNQLLFIENNMPTANDFILKAEDT